MQQTPTNRKYTTRERNNMKLAQKWTAMHCDRSKLTPEILHGAQLTIGTFPEKYRKAQVENWERTTGQRLEPIVKEGN